MNDIEKSIAPLIEDQFPEFYKTDGPNFIAFVKAYYDFISDGGNEARNILTYRDIDTTIDQFLNKFKDEYLNGIPYPTFANTRNIVKHIQDLYKSKGSNQSIKLLFRLIFGIDAEIYNPGLDIIKPSDGKWIIPRYLECNKSNKSFSLIGQIIKGSITGSTAFVDSVARKKVAGKFLDIVYISDIQGQFLTGEIISADGTLEDAPKIVGSLNEITVTNGGTNNKVGDLLSVTSSDGKGGIGIVTSTYDGSGIVSFNLRDGGYGYEQTNTSVYISNLVISVSNSSSYFPPLGRLIQPMQEFEYETLNGVLFAVGDYVNGYDSSNTIQANGFVIAIKNATANSGNLIISVTNGDWNYATSYIATVNNTSNAVYFNSNDITAFATVVDSNSSQIGIVSNTAPIYSKGTVFLFETNPIGIISSSNTSHVVTGNNTVFTEFVLPGDFLYIRSSNAIIGTVASVANDISLTLTSNCAVTLTANTQIWRGSRIAYANTGSIYDVAASGANFSLGSIINPETIRINTDIISSNNTTNTNFLDILVSGNNSGVSGNSYGFPLKPTANINSVISSVLNYNAVTIGSIQSISKINVGRFYNASPFVYIRDNNIADYDRYNLQINLGTTNNRFAANTFLYQDQIVNFYDLLLGSTTGTFQIGEGVIQHTSNAHGIVAEINSPHIRVNTVSGTFNGTDYIIGQTSGANATPNSISSNTITVQARAFIKSAISNTIVVEQESYTHQFNTSDAIYSIDALGVKTGQGTVKTVYTVPSKQMGTNANVVANVSSSVGIANTVKVISSGFGYSEAIQLQLINLISNNAGIIFGQANVYTAGVANGYWQDNRGKLNSDKYIHDNYFYQEYSYQIRSRLSIQTYADILKKVLHVSGTLMFGEVIITSEDTINLNTQGVIISGVTASPIPPPPPLFFRIYQPYTTNDNYLDTALDPLIDTGIRVAYVGP